MCNIIKMWAFNSMRTVLFVYVSFTILLCETVYGSRDRLKSLDFYIKNLGESCNETETCNFREWLKCDKDLGLCVCVDPDDLLHDTGTNRCVARVGAKCRRRVRPYDEPEEILQPSLMTNPNELIQLFNIAKDEKRIDCIQNSYCDSSEFRTHKCKCYNGYFASSTGTCVVQKSFPESCAHDKECILLLSCMDGICKCKDSLVFDKRDKRCAIPVEEPCSTDFNSRLGVSYKPQNCTSNANCKGTPGVCKCGENYVVSSDGSCRPDFGQNCSSEDPCSEMMACRNGICSCKWPLHQYYQNTTKECISLVSGPCTSLTEVEDIILASTLSLAVQNCTKNAHCVNNGVYSECLCLEGFVENTQGECVKGFGSKCEKDEECDNLTPLFCVNGKCDCEDLYQAYDSRRRKCVGLVGSRCWRFPVANFLKNVPELCVDNAICSQTVPELYGKCLCDDDNGYYATADRFCRFVG